MKKSKEYKENNFLNILINVIIPTVILVKFSTENYLGPTLGLFTALAFPIAYGITDYAITRTLNFFSLIGLLSVVLTGGIGYFQLDPKYLAIKEAGVPLLLGLAILAFQKKYPFVQKLLEEVVDAKLIYKKLEEQNNLDKYKKRMRTGTLLVAASFGLSSILNYALAKLIVKSPPGTEAFNAELGKMTALSYPVIAIPSTIVMVAALVYVLWGAAKLTGLELEALLGAQDKGATEKSVEKARQ